LLALSCRAMSHNISALTVGAGQDLDHHDATRSCWVSLSHPLLKGSRSTPLEHLRLGIDRRSWSQGQTQPSHDEPPRASQSSPLPEGEGSGEGAPKRLSSPGASFTSTLSCR
jgi:hypothetical protein